MENDKRRYRAILPRWLQTNLGTWALNDTALSYRLHTMAYPAELPEQPGLRA